MQRFMSGRVLAPGCAFVLLAAVVGLARGETPDLVEVTLERILRWDIDSSGVDYNRITGIYGFGDMTRLADGRIVAYHSPHGGEMPALYEIDPVTGTVLWRYAFGNRFDATCATPVWARELLFISAAYGTGCAALEIARDGGKWSVRERWRHRDLQNIFGTSMVLGGHLYGHHGDLGTITLRCLDLETGAVKWAARQPGRATMIAVQGHLIVLDEHGGLRLVEARPDGYQAKGEVRDLLEFKAWAAPALARGRLYVRDQKHLVCLDVRKR